MTELALIESVMDEWMTSEDPTAVIRCTIRQARGDALEEAATLISNEANPQTMVGITRRRCAAEIRALKGPG